MDEFELVLNELESAIRDDQYHGNTGTEDAYTPAFRHSVRELFAARDRTIEELGTALAEAQNSAAREQARRRSAEQELARRIDAFEARERKNIGRPSQRYVMLHPQFWKECREAHKQRRQQLADADQTISDLLDQLTRVRRRAQEMEHDRDNALSIARDGEARAEQLAKRLRDEKGVSWQERAEKAERERDELRLQSIANDKQAGVYRRERDETLEALGDRVTDLVATEARAENAERERDELRSTVRVLTRERDAALLEAKAAVALARPVVTGARRETVGAQCELAQCRAELANALEREQILFEQRNEWADKAREAIGYLQSLAKTGPEASARDAMNGIAYDLHELREDVAAERERCARVCEARADRWKGLGNCATFVESVLRNVATEIRKGAP